MTDETEKGKGLHIRYVALDATTPEGRAQVEQLAAQALPLLPEREFDFDPDTVATLIQAGNFVGGVTRLGFAGVAKIATGGVGPFIDGGARELMRAVAGSREVLSNVVDQEAWRNQLFSFPDSLILGATVGVAFALVGEHESEHPGSDRLKVARAVYRATCRALSQSMHVPEAIDQIFSDPITEQMLAAKALGRFNEVRARALYRLCKEEMVRLAPAHSLGVLGGALINFAESHDPAIDLPGILGWVMLMANQGTEGFDRLLEDMIEQLGSVVDGATEDNA